MDKDVGRQDVAAAADEAHGTKRRGLLFKALIAGAIIALATVAALVIRNVHEANEQRRREQEALRLAIIQSGVIHEGIRINGVNVGGMTPEEAAEALAPVVKQLKEDARIPLSLGDAQYELDADGLGLTADTQAVVEKAFLVGRDGTLEALTALLEELKARGRTYTLSCAADEAILRKSIRALAEQVNKAPVDARFAMLVDREGLTKEELKSEEFVLAASATTHEERMRFEPEEDGIQLDEEALYQAIAGMVKSGRYADMELPVTRTSAQITLENIRSKVVLRGAFSSSFAKSPYNRGTRVFNIRKTASLINGVVVLPGEVFSTNDTLGNRTYSAGWKAAPAIVRGRTEDQAGGGVCQASSTLYNCVLMADLEIVYRQGHSGRISYVDGGLDATIDSGRIDFKWRNNTEHPIYVFSWVDMEEKRLHYEIYGEPIAGEYDQIKLSSKKISNISPPGPMQYTVDYSKPVGYSSVYVSRKSGSVWQSYATYYKDGVEVKTEKIAKTTYRAYAGETIVGPSAAPAGGYFN